LVPPGLPAKHGIMRSYTIPEPVEPSACA
jgi:hypothetical protein